MCRKLSKWLSDTLRSKKDLFFCNHRVVSIKLDKVMEKFDSEVRILITLFTLMSDQGRISPHYIEQASDEYKEKYQL